MSVKYMGITTVLRMCRDRDGHRHRQGNEKIKSHVNTKSKKTNST